MRFVVGGVRQHLRSGAKVAWEARSWLIRRSWVSNGRTGRAWALVRSERTRRIRFRYRVVVSSHARRCSLAANFGPARRGVWGKKLRLFRVDGGDAVISSDARHRLVRSDSGYRESMGSDRRRAAARGWRGGGFVVRGAGESLSCPECGGEANRHDARRRSWRHLPTCQYRTILTADVPRVRCAEHGVRTIGVPWSDPGSRFTALFEAW